jgi:phosphatidylserine decarboxylase
MDIIANITHGKSFNTFKYSYDTLSTPKPDYDDDNHSDRDWLGNGETSKHRLSVDLRGMAKSLSDNRPEPVINYFLDGSRRVYHVDDIAYDRNVFPVIAGQVGVACCRRENRRLYSQPPTVNELVLALPKDCDQDGHHTDAYLAKVTKQINDHEILRRLGLSFSQIVAYNTDKTVDAKMEDRGTAKIQDYMINAEKRTVDNLATTGKLSASAYLIKDGSLEYIPMSASMGRYADIRTFKDSYRWVIGASKSFNPENCRDKNNKPNADSIFHLEEGFRTPVMRFVNKRIENLTFAVWYLRLRDVKRTRTPFDGVLKLERILVTDSENDDGLDSDEVDMISATILNERNPTCYGADLRFANHLYPIYLTESFIKSNFMSGEMLLRIF